MAIVRASDLDAQMGRSIDPKSIPTHNGGTQGAMEANFVAQSDLRISEQGAGRFGAQVFEPQEMGDPRLYGSQTVISLNEAPPLEAKLEPKAEPVKTIPVTPLTGHGMPVLAPATAPLPVAKLPPVGARNISQLMASLRRPGG